GYQEPPLVALGSCFRRSTVKVCRTALERLRNLRPQIFPMRVISFDQIDLPSPLPFLHLEFAQPRSVQVFIGLVPDEQLTAVLLGEACDQSVAMLVRTSREVAGDADIERPVALARHDVDAAGFRRSSPKLRSCGSRSLGLQARYSSN